MDKVEAADLAFCKGILPKVSRTFAINISILSGELYQAVVCAYLLCRIADTLEDSIHLESTERERLLQEYIDLFDTSSLDLANAQTWAECFKISDQSNAEQILISKSIHVFRLFNNLSNKTQTAISKSVIEMAKGMKETVTEARKGELTNLKTIADLDRYCYYVAGTVGVMLTNLFTNHAKGMSQSSIKLAKELEVSFGLGLQVTNIIKDCYEDYQRGWCYIPSELAEKKGVKITEFFNSEKKSAALQTLNELILKAISHLDDALNYSLLIPRREFRMRLFCLLPLFMAVRTLQHCWNNDDLLNGVRKVKISRNEVYLTFLECTAFVSSNSLLRCAYNRHRNKIEKLN